MAQSTLSEQKLLERFLEISEILQHLVDAVTFNGGLAMSIARQAGVKLPYGIEAISDQQNELSSEIGALIDSILDPDKDMAPEKDATVCSGSGTASLILRSDREAERTETGLEVETALGEVLAHAQEVLAAHVRSETALLGRIVDDPAAGRVAALRKRMKLSRRKFADRFGLDARAVQDWEQGRRVPDRAARVLLTVIDHNPEAVERALAPPED